MKNIRLEGIKKPVSRLVLGVDHQTDVATASPQFERFAEAGGTCFDTAWIYGGDGKCERVLGEWIAATGCREQVVILGKGGHTPWCNPIDIRKHLHESLDRLRTDYVDIYMLHRDNPALPVDELIDVFDEIYKAGQAHVFGVSNWTLERVDEANEYARAAGRPLIAAVSNQFSLARMVEAPWEGCVTATEDVSREWFASRQIPLFAWSSQAHAFFAGFASPDSRNESHLAKCWYSAENLERLARAEQLASAKSNNGQRYSATNVALTYVLGQQFPTCALVGPRTAEELESTLQALRLELTPGENAWLDLRLEVEEASGL